MTSIHTRLVVAACALALCTSCGETNEPEPADQDTSSNNTSGGTTDTSANNTTNDTSGNNTSGTTTPMADAETLLGELNTLSDQYGCTLAFTCPEEQPFSLFEYGKFADEQECLAGPNVQFWAELDIEELEDSIAAGRVELDLTVLQQCVDDFGAQVMGDPCAADPNALFDLGFCPQAFDGKVPMDGNCLTGFDCADGALCDFDADEDTCFGTCTGTIAIGQACEPGFDPDTPCVRGATCIPDEGGDGSAGTCVEELSVKQGQYCGDEDIVCEGDLLCDFETVLCVSPPTSVVLTPGSQCDAFSNEEFCPAGSVCADVDEDTELGTCGAPSTTGEACSVFLTTCAAGLFCQAGEQDIFSGTCRALLTDGDMCEFSLDCASSRCENGICASTLACMVP